MVFFLGPFRGLIRGKFLACGQLGELVALGRDNGVVNITNFCNTIPSSAVTATAVETAFDQNYTVLANSLRAGSYIKIRGQGIVTAHNATDTLQVKLYIGGLSGTALVTQAAAQPAVNAIFYFEANIIVRTVGASGTMVAWSQSQSVTGTADAAAGIGSTTLNTTTTQQIAASALWSTNNAGNSCRLDLLTVEIA